MLAWAGQVATCLSRWMELVVVHWQGRLAWVTVVASLYMAEAGLLAGLELVVRLVLVLVHVQEVRSQGRREWMRKIRVDHNMTPLLRHSVPHEFWACAYVDEGCW